MFNPSCKNCTSSWSSSDRLVCSPSQPYIRSDDLSAVVDATVAMMDRVMVGGGIARRKKKGEINSQENS